MKKTPEFTNFLDAIKDILNGKPVDDLGERMEACDFGIIAKFDGTIGSRQEFIDVCYACGYSKDENKILNGEDPVEIYGCAGWQTKAQENLRQFLDKYKQYL